MEPLSPLIPWDLLSSLIFPSLWGGLSGAGVTLVPGLHVNALSEFVQAPPPFHVAAFSAQSFVALAMGVLLSPTDDSVASLHHPSYRLAREGRASEAIARLVLGAYFGFLAGLGFLPLLLLFPPPARALGRVIPLLLLGLYTSFIISESWNRRALLDSDFTPLLGAPRRYTRSLRALLVFVVTGAIGWMAFRITFDSPLRWGGSPLLPLLSGIFGVPPLLLDLQERNPPSELSVQGTDPPPPKPSTVLEGSIPALLIAILPTLSAGHIVLLALLFSRRGEGVERALERGGVVVGASSGVSVSAFLAWGVTRSGPLVHSLPAPDWSSGALPPEVPLLFISALLGATLGASVARGLSRVGLLLRRVAPRKRALTALLFLGTSTLLLSGWKGLILLSVASLGGLLPILLGVRRIHAMGCLGLPTLLYYL